VTAAGSRASPRLKLPRLRFTTSTSPAQPDMLRVPGREEAEDLRENTAPVDEDGAERSCAAVADRVVRSPP
jgi:hypothetical protein